MSYRVAVQIDTMILGFKGIRKMIPHAIDSFVLSEKITFWSHDYAKPRAFLQVIIKYTWLGNDAARSFLGLASSLQCPIPCNQRIRQGSDLYGSTRTDTR